MTIYKTTEVKQLWKDTSNQVVVFVEVIPPTNSQAEFTYKMQEVDMGSESDFVSSGWVKISESHYVGNAKPQMPITQSELDDVDKDWEGF